MLREYQERALKEIHRRVSEGHRSILCVAPTGAGKTIIFAKGIVEPCYLAGQRCWVIAPGIQLVEQASAKLTAMGIRHGVIQADHYRTNYQEAIQVASIPSLHSRLKSVRLNAPDVIIIDEAHRATDENQFGAVIERSRELNPHVIVILFTATPERSDGRGLGRLATTMIQVSTISELQRMGYLIPVRYLVGEHVDLGTVPQARGDYEQAALGERMSDSKIIGNAVDLWRQYAQGRRTIAFCTTVAQAEYTCKAYNESGIRSRVITAETPPEIRQRYFKDLHHRRLDVIHNVNVLAEGFDLPSVECIQMLRPTKSVSRYLQMGGRGLRPAKGMAADGEYLLFIDQANLVEEHGWLHEEREWSLDDGYVKPKPTKEYQPKCPKCETVLGRTLPSHCPSCLAPIDRQEFDPAQFEDPTKFKLVIPEQVALEEKRKAELQLRQALYAELEERAFIEGLEPFWVWLEFKKRAGKWPTDKDRAASRQRIIFMGVRHGRMQLNWRHEVSPL